ncbi:uncharacterized protein LOC101762429 [Setaria italica]|uniref:uncharacterized protein LOC101762429 n=1 Tax=Setaria italica TaxID=4555 RepID=UPI000351133D|nr:uncharacterized protein LOC101762429 [Setaria italica]XP_034586549.1 uncharacterized protein LOC117849056 [Setaria viridis]XP_034586572.1 uncharacterized protein LOC117849083 [Setaria viridis]
MACSLLPSAAPFFPSPSCRRVQPLSPCARPFQPSPPPSRVVLVRWTPPPPGWYKVSFDASVYNDGSRRASIGGAIRDGAGRVVLAYAEQTEHSTVGIVEARAMIRGLRLALALGLQRVVVEGDDLVLVQLLRGEETQTRIPVAMQEEIVGLLRCFPGRDVRHIYREGNQVAHTLCRQAYHGPGVWVGGCNRLPPAVWEKAEEDRRGVAHERTVLRAG